MKWIKMKPLWLYVFIMPRILDFLILLVALLILFGMLYYIPYEKVEAFLHLKKLEKWEEFIVFVASVFTVIGVWFAIKSIHTTLSVYEATFINDANQKYSSDEMYSLLKLLGDFDKAHAKARAVYNRPNGDFMLDGCYVLGPEYRTDKSSPNKRIGHFFENLGDAKVPSLYGLVGNQAKYADKAQTTLALNVANLHDARRKVKFYFLNIFDLYKQGKIRHSVLKAVVDKNAVNLLFNIIEPLEYIHNREYNHDRFYEMMLFLRPAYKKYNEKKSPVGESSQSHSNNGKKTANHTQVMNTTAPAQSPVTQTGVVQQGASVNGGTPASGQPSVTPPASPKKEAEKVERSSTYQIKIFGIPVFARNTQSVEKTAWS